MNEPRFMRIAGIAGIAGVLLLLIANLQLGSTPKAEDPLEKVASFLTDNRSQALVFVLLFGLGYILLLTFTVGLWELLRRAGDSSGLPALVFAAGLWVLVVGSAALVSRSATRSRSRRAWRSAVRRSSTPACRAPPSASNESRSGVQP